MKDKTGISLQLGDKITNNQFDSSLIVINLIEPNSLLVQDEEGDMFEMNSSEVEAII